MLYIINTQQFQILAAVIGVVEPYPIPTPLYCVCVCVCPFIVPWLALARILGNSLLSSSDIPSSTTSSCTDLASVSGSSPWQGLLPVNRNMLSLFSCLHDQTVAYLSRANSISDARRQLQSSWLPQTWFLVYGMI